jgi:hypothetical protein
MKSIALIALVLTSFINGASADELASNAETKATEAEVEIAPNMDNDKGKTQITENADFCFFRDVPPPDSKYTIVKRLKVGKGTYGGVKDILPALADHARKAGADAMIRYTGSQRFGFLPWRMVRPVVRGIAIKWADSQKPDCAAIGGTTLKTILATDKPPAQ